jgi:eukaryotic-like serine/threonine-protein kinase
VSHLEIPVGPERSTRAAGTSSSAIEACPFCGERTASTAAECRRCGRSLVVQVDSATARGPQRRAESFRPPELARPVEVPLDYAPGELFAERYIVIDRLGQGGMGVVYKARDRELNRTVALKMIRGNLEGDVETMERFRREPGLAQQVTHENVCRVHDLGIADGLRYISMEYLEARTLAELIGTVGTLSTRQTLEIAVQICAGLQAVHARDIVHRDLKPSNIAVDGTGRVVVVDFGLARGPVDSEVTQPGALVGSYAYLAPEHIRGEALTAAADVYALGLVLYEMLTARRPPGDEDRRPLAMRGESAELPPPSAYALDAPRELDAVVLRCLRWKAHERPTIAEVKEALEACLAEERRRTEPVAKARAGPERRRRRARALLALAALLPVLVAGATLLRRTRGAAPLNVAVLPFTFEGTGEDGRFLTALSADGLSAGLSAAPGVRVSPVEAKIRSRPRSTIAGTLGVEWVLGGNVRIEGNDVVWHPQVWSRSGELAWERDVRSSSALRGLDQVRDALVERFVPQARGATLRDIETLRTRNEAAYRKYLEARALHEGWYSEQEGSLDEARSLYQQAVRLDGTFAAAQAGQAMASLGSYLKTHDPGDMSVARYARERALAFGEGLPEAKLADGVVLAGEGRWEEARQSFEAAFELAPGDVPAWCNVADLYETLGRSEEARALFERAIQRQPLFWLNHYWYGQFLYRAGNLKAASVYLERARELAPEEKGPVTLLGFYHFARGDLNEAKQEFGRALELSSDPHSRQRLGLVHYYTGEFQTALEQWSLVLAAEPDRPGAHADVGDALRQLHRDREARERYREAVALYDETIAASPTDELLAQRAQVLAASARCDRARTDMSGVLARYPDNPDYLYYGALVAGRCGFDDWAVELVLQSIGAGNVVGIWFDPDLARVRLDPRVRRPLELIGSP